MSIFQNLPNDLIRKIIRQADGGLYTHKKKFESTWLLEELIHGGYGDDDFVWDEETDDYIPVAAHLIRAGTYHQDQMYPGPRTLSNRGTTSQPTYSNHAWIFNGSIMRSICGRI
jgi:hypothetical protein